jgi:hypothetical protein
VGLLLLMAWVPSCTQTGENQAETPQVAALEGDPIDASMDLPQSPPRNSPFPPQTPTSSGKNAPLKMASAGVDLKSASPVVENGVLPLSFAYLSSYEYDVPDPFAMKTMKDTDLKKLSDQIPEYIKKLNTKKVALSGYMVPIDVVNEGVKSFILTYSQMMCCFGQMPWYNEWVFVEMPEGKPAEYQLDVPITVSGQLEVGEEIEDGFVVSLYRMKGDKVAVAGEPIGKVKTN